MKKQISKLREKLFLHIFGLRTNCNYNKQVKKFRESKGGKENK